MVSVSGSQGFVGENLSSHFPLFPSAAPRSGPSSPALAVASGGLCAPRCACHPIGSSTPEVIATKGSPAGSAGKRARNGARGWRCLRQLRLVVVRASPAPRLWLKLSPGGSTYCCRGLAGLDGDVSAGSSWGGIAAAAQHHRRAGHPEWRTRAIRWRPGRRRRAARGRRWRLGLPTAWIVVAGARSGTYRGRRCRGGCGKRQCSTHSVFNGSTARLRRNDESGHRKSRRDIACEIEMIQIAQLAADRSRSHTGRRSPKSLVSDANLRGASPTASSARPGASNGSAGRAAVPPADEDARHVVR